MKRHAPHTAPAVAWCAHTRQQAAQILHVPVSQIDAAIARGDLTPTRIGKHIRIPDSELRRFAGQAPLQETA
jgi:excisionase family DNA binding protein